MTMKKTKAMWNKKRRRQQSKPMKQNNPKCKLRKVFKIPIKMKTKIIIVKIMMKMKATIHKMKIIMIIQIIVAFRAILQNI